MSASDIATSPSTAIYSSPCYTPEAPRWRLILLLAKPWPPAEWSRLVARAAGMFNVVFSRESYVLSQSHYFGAVEGRPPAIVLESDGPGFQCIDERGDLDASARWPSPQSNGAAEQSASGEGEPEADEADPWTDEPDPSTEPQRRAAASTEPPTIDSDAPVWPGPMGAHAYHGLIGEIVNAIAPTTEADRHGVLLQTLVFFGNKIGRGPHDLVEADQHATNLFMLLVGNTAKARKGTSEGRVRQMVAADTTDRWAETCIHSGLASGEGLIFAVRDAVYQTNRKTQVLECIDEGVTDKRALIIEREFGSTLRVLQRPGNTLSAVMRNAWDRGTFQTLTMHPLRATDALVSIIGHVTEGELRGLLDNISLVNGFANRFIFCCVRRERLLLHGGGLDPAIVSNLGGKLAAAAEAARRVGRVTMTDVAGQEWDRIYLEIAPAKPGLLGAVVARCEAQIIRLALLYALADKKTEIGFVHLLAAREVWRYCEDSALYLFADMLGDPVADPIIRALREAGANGLTRSQILRLFSGHMPTGLIQRALDALARQGRAREARRPGVSRPGPATETWHIVPTRQP